MNLPIPTHVDFAVIGAGPAGSATAALLVRMGLQTVLLEKSIFPRDKLCGEFLSTEAMHLLERVGCRDEVLQYQPPEIHQARFTDSSGRFLEFALPGSAYGLSRKALDACLFRHAQQCGVKVFEGVEVQSIQPDSERVTLRIRSVASDSTQAITASRVIAAYGRRSRLDAQQGRTFLKQTHPYVGFKRHHRYMENSGIGRELDDTVEIHLFSDGYCGMCFVEGEVVNVCLLVNKKFLSTLPIVNWESIVESLRQKNPYLQQRFAGLEALEDPMQSVAQVSFAHKEKSRGRVLFVGDAAGMISPMCGDGQAMALQSAVLLAKLIQEKMSGKEQLDEELGLQWERLWNREFQSRMSLGYGLQKILLNPLRATIGLRIAKALPLIPRWLVKRTRGGNR